MCNAQSFGNHLRRRSEAGRCSLLRWSPPRNTNGRRRRDRGRDRSSENRCSKDTMYKKYSHSQIGRPQLDASNLGIRILFVDISPVVANQNLSWKLQERFRLATTGEISTKKILIPGLDGPNGNSCRQSPISRHFATTITIFETVYVLLFRGRNAGIAPFPNDVALEDNKYT